MELMQLRTFLTVSATGNFTRASEELGISQSAVSHRMSSLEKELGVALFMRTGKRLALTRHGKLVQRYSKEIFAHINAIPQELNRAKTTSKPGIRISACLRSLCNPFIAMRRDFLKICQNAEVYFQSAESFPDVIRQVKEGKAEVGITGKMIEAQRLRTIPYGEFRMIPVVGKKHRLANSGSDLQLTNLADEEWVLFDKETRMRRVSDLVFAEKNFMPSRIYESNDGAVLLNQVVLGKGIGLLPSWAITAEIEAGHLVELNLGLEIKTPIYFVISATNDSPLVKKFIDFMKTNQLEGVSMFDKNTR